MEEQSAHTLPKRIQGESHPQPIGNIADDLSLSHMHCPMAQTVCWHPFVNNIMEADIPLGWKPLNLERYDGTTNLDKHLDTFLTQVNLYTNDDAILYHVFSYLPQGSNIDLVRWTST